MNPKYLTPSFVWPIGLFLNLFVLHVSLSKICTAGQLSIGNDLGGVRSPYTEVLRKWSMDATVLSSQMSNRTSEFKISCYKTDSNPLYIGLKQEFRIEAPVDRVRELLDGFNHYTELFPDYKEIKVVERSANRLTVDWEQIIPIPFVSNIRYRMLYEFGRSKPGTWIFRYQLKESKDLIFNDGIIYLEASGKDQTQYLGYDFMDAHWGIAKTFAPGKIWKDSVEGIVISDLIVKLKSENPTLSYKEVQQQAKKKSPKELVRSCVDNKINFDKN